MDLLKEITEAYPELTWVDFRSEGVINLQNDSDGTGDYIAKWQYSKPVPEALAEYIR
jgi:hypothetical protein